MLQPWIDRWDGKRAAATPPLGSGPARESHPILGYPSQVMDALGELLLIGLQRTDQQTARSWQELCRQGATVGFVRFLAPLEQLANELAQKANTLRWDWRGAARAAIVAAVLAKLAQEEGCIQSRGVSSVLG